MSQNTPETKLDMVERPGWQARLAAAVLAVPAWLAFVAGAAAVAAIVLLPVWLSLMLAVLAAAALAYRVLAVADPGPIVSSNAALPAGRRRRVIGDWTLMIDALPDAAILIGGAEDVLHANAAARELFPRLAPGVPLSSRLRQPNLIEAVDAARRQETAIEVDLTERIPVERRIVARLARLTPGNEPVDDVPILVTFRDLSEEDRLARTRADFVANASHELRTPLAAVRGFVETLQGAARHDEAARERFLAMMSNQALRMSRLIDDLLSLSRIEMKQHLPPRDEVDLNDVAQEAAQTIAPLAEAAGSTLELRLLDRPARIRGEHDELLQAVQNLMQNAVKYGRPQGHVRVALTAAHDGRRLTLAVTDEGAGIPPQHLPRLTERFYRVNPTTSRDLGGTGLGLAIVKHIVNRHRGHLDISSAVGKGSRFAISFDALRQNSGQDRSI